MKKIIYTSMVFVGLVLPIICFSEVFNGKDGDHVGYNGVPVHIGKAGSKIAFYGQTPTPKPIITAVDAASIVAALAAEGLLATATPTATATATFTPTPTPTAP